MKKILFFSVLAVFFIACENDTPVEGNNNYKPIKTVSLNSHEDTVNYALGIVVGSQMKKYGIDNIDYEIVLRAIEDVLKTSDQNLPIHPDVAQNIVNLYVQKTLALKQVGEHDLNTRFLEENKTKSGVITLDNGLQYKVLKEGNGIIPTLNDKVKINFSGQLVDGTVFSDTYNSNPAEFVVKNSLKGWQKALVNMKEGAEWVIYLPPELAFGTTGSKKVPPNSVVIYKLELIDVN